MPSVTCAHPWSSDKTNRFPPEECLGIRARGMPLSCIGANPKLPAHGEERSLFATTSSRQF